MIGGNVLKGGGESGIVRLIDVGHGAGISVCGGARGKLGRFCTKLPKECDYAIHLTVRADIKAHHGYLRVAGGTHDTAEGGWCVRMDLFGDNKEWGLDLGSPPHSGSVLERISPKCMQKRNALMLWSPC
jgi:hypothetical protein